MPKKSDAPLTKIQKIREMFERAGGDDALKGLESLLEEIEPA